MSDTTIRSIMDMDPEPDAVEAFLAKMKQAGCDAVQILFTKHDPARGYENPGHSGYGNMYARRELARRWIECPPYKDCGEIFAEWWK